MRNLSPKIVRPREKTPSKGTRKIVYTFIKLFNDMHVASLRLFRLKVKIAKEIT